MSRQKKIIATILWAVLVTAMVGLVAGRLGNEEKPANADGVVQMVSTDSAPNGLPEMYDAPPFALIDQDGQAFTDQQLHGSVWIADFVFTHCAGPCPMMSAKMAKLQGEIADKKVRFVSFSVDPDRDTPAVLKEYARQFNGDSARWSLLTGPIKDIYAVAAGLHLTALPAEGENPIIHDERFLLIDQNGKVRGIYSSKSDEKMQKLVIDAKTLAGSGGKTL